ncbi:hypothetical protein [Piscirickettsia litoralis]|uniref:Uncharacterized protein n=1 Tax=Piscirickettsia litoralis TaxID=1891921 RepID=A0ABX2ZZ26_9GAMM|nr:hypothetical protein [Piscirickettsia litoralis]ODN41649.1 hypothetical protein BGC07_16285 [Piscirickettsia litoralis]
MVINNNLEFKAHLDVQNIDSSLCRNQTLRQLVHSPQHFCFFDIKVNIATPYKAKIIDFYIELSSYECIGDIINHLQFNVLTLLGLHYAHASRIYLNDADHYPILLGDSGFF